jgi:hypothetical protein
MTDRIEEIRARLNTNGYYDPEDGNDAGTAYSRARNDIDYLLTLVPRWIPVTERLPEEGVPVQVVAVDVAMPVTWGLCFGEWWEVTDGEGLLTRDVTHWMPLPEPPKEEE